MIDVHRIHANVFINNALTPAIIEYDSHIRNITPTTKESALTLIPGFVDLHVHGGNGFDVMQGYKSIKEIARFHALNGTLALAPTTMTAKTVDIEKVLKDIATLMNEEHSDIAIILGAHLEGPFINPQALGAQPDFCIEPDAQIIASWLKLCPISVATIAPELKGALLAASVLQCSGTKVQIGHTKCTCSRANLALTAGFKGFTHLYNAMSPLTHRDAGAVASALGNAQYAEIIVDGIHVERDAVMVARRAIPNCYAVSDGTAATGMKDGSFKLGDHKVFKKDNSVRLKDGTLAGSAITMFDAFRTLIDWGLPLSECIAWCCHRPAQYIGRTELTRVEKNSYANFNLIELNEVTLRTTVLNGKIIAEY